MDPWRVAQERLRFRLRNVVGPYYHFLPLHKAIVENNLDDLESLLQYPNVDINLQDEWGGTPLFVSLERERSSSFIVKLIQAGCDVKIADKTKVTPLHLAIASSSNGIAHELIKRGADINTQEEHVHVRDSITMFGSYDEESINQKTPLHVAVQHGNLEGVCMLLCYGANVYITCSRDLTPLSYAICRKLQDKVKILINFYDESYYNFVLGRHIENADASNLLDFSVSWLEYLHLILNLFSTYHFTISYECVHHDSCTDSFFCHLFKAFNSGDIPVTTRLGIINMCLSLGASTYVNDLEEAHKTCGFGEELEALIYGYTNNNYYEKDPVSFISFILGLEKDFSIKLLTELFESYFYKRTVGSTVYKTLRVHANYFISVLRFFSLPVKVKQEIKNLCCNLAIGWQQFIFSNLDQMPEFPTLLELSRNQARKYVKQINGIKYPYQFHDAVKKLNVSKPNKDLILLKIPLH